LLRRKTDLHRLKNEQKTELMPDTAIQMAYWLCQGDINRLTECIEDAESVLGFAHPAKQFLQDFLPSAVNCIKADKISIDKIIRDKKRQSIFKIKK